MVSKRQRRQAGARCAWAVAWAALFIPGPAAAAGSSAAAALRADCDAPAHQRLLSPAAALPASGAAAVWRDARHLQWPGQPALQPGERLRLALSAAGTLVAEPGQPVRGADRLLPLLGGAHEAAEGPSATGARRFAHLAPGLHARVPAAWADRLGPALWRGQSLLLREDADGRIVAVTALQTPGALDDRYARQAEVLVLGVTAPAVPRQAATTSAGAAAAGRSTRFALWAPTARAVHLCLYPGAQSPVQAVQPLAWQPASGAWQAALPGDRSGGYYTYLVDVFVPGTGWVRNRVTDPYAVSLNADGRRSWIGRLDAPATRPEGWATDRAPATVQAATDLVVYELHVRDFSLHDPAVPPAQRGRYLAFTQADSHGMRHLRALARAGLTDIHLLPVYDYGSVPERGCAQPAIHPPAERDSRVPQAAIEPVKERDCYNWGYDPVHYSAPEGSFASDPDDGPGRVRELRQMVMALHRAGLRVGMDVVYNHTFAAGQHEKSVLDRIVPGYYHRLNARGEVERSTCCDNTATEHAMMARLMSDSVRLWAREHHIDSFRFDLMGHQPRAVMEAMQARLRRELGREIHFIGEGWNFGEVADGRRFVQASQQSLNGSGIGTFSDRGRDALRGGGAGDSGAALVTRQGWLSGLHHTPNEAVQAADAAASAPPDRRTELLRAADLVRVGLAGTLRDYPMQTAAGDTRPLAALDYAGQPAGYASEPAEVVNYVENHDNQTLFDGLAMKLPRSLPAAERARIQTLGAAVVAFSQGVAYFHAGQDILRSKNLDRNSYNSGDWFNRLDWTGQTNHFGTGLPPEGDNGRDWPLMAPLLADPALAPTPADIAHARQAFLDLLKIRASTPLLRLRTAAEVQAQLRLLNTGPQQEPTVLVGHLRRAVAGGATPGGPYAELAYFINVGPEARTLTLPELQGREWQLHPVHRAPEAADDRPRQAAHDPATGRFQVPPRTAVVWVRY